MSERRLRLGIAGLGRAFSLMLPTFARHPLVEVAAGADPRPEARTRFGKDFPAATAYATVEELCRDRAVEAVYIATPHQFHADNVVAAADHGKHVLVEKPMALTLAQCQAMIDAARRVGVYLVVGHSHSFDAPIWRTRALVAGGTFGRLRMITALNYTDFLYRPRRPEELVTAQGGGVIFNQAPHQVDVVRLIGGGRVRSVRAALGVWDRERPTEGAYNAWLTFDDGVSASLTYSGYAHFDSDELCEWFGESGERKHPSGYGAARRALARAGTPDAELELKSGRNYGGTDYPGPPSSSAGERWHQHFGVVIVSCERADLRPLPRGVMIYDDTDARLDALDPPAVPRSEVIDELYASVVHNRPPDHSGEWGMATMEVCVAMLESAREQREIALQHQIGLPERALAPAPAKA
jgi:phthalate 4,5-cis-dihydrodiol dehydrogenase